MWENVVTVSPKKSVFCATIPGKEVRELVSVTGGGTS